MNPRFHASLLTLTTLIFASGVTTSRAQTTAGYAGDISTTFGSVTDTCAFSFALYDATAGGSQIGPVIERTLRVRGGLYETELDFGPEAFEGGSRYLEVAVGCPAGTAALTTLIRRAFHPTTGTRSRRGDPEQAATQGSPASPKAALGTAFTYQGELKQSGAPATGSGDFQFSLWDTTSGGAQIGATVPASAILVEEGRFTAQLDFGAAAFDGEARWLEIAVDFPSGTGSFTTLTPRQPLSAAPYALQTRGVFVDDTGEVGVGTTNPQAQLHIETDASQTLRVRNNAASGGLALSATAAAHSGWATAISAYTASPAGVGVSSFNEAESGNAFAVAAETNSPDGIAVFGHASNGGQYSTGVGVSGHSDGDYGGAGVYGEATAPGGTSYGVHGVAATGTGVHGKNEATGNRGSLGTNTAGVAGHVDNPSDYSAYFTGGSSYFEGNVGIGTDSPTDKLHVTGGDTRVDGSVVADTFAYTSEKTHSLNIPAFALQQSSPDNNDEWVTWPQYGYVSNGSGSYSVSLAAPVHLPNNATLTELTAYFYDASAGGDLYLGAQIWRREHFALDTEMIADLRHGTTGTLAEILSTSRSMSGPATIDNSAYQYLVIVSWFPDVLGSDLRLYGLRIEYTIATLNP